MVQGEKIREYVERPLLLKAEMENSRKRKLELKKQEGHLEYEGDLKKKYKKSEFVGISVAKRFSTIAMKSLAMQ